jgi:hypothetical protein
MNPVHYYLPMASKFGHGFVVNLILIAKHFAHPPEQAWFGAADHVDGIVLPDRFSGTDVETLLVSLRKHLIWHQPGTMDKEDAYEVNRLLDRISVAVDRELGIQAPDTGEYH